MIEPIQIVGAVLVLAGVVVYVTASLRERADIEHWRALDERQRDSIP